ncbi:MAG: hypothetical protein J6T12_03185 [Salinivirgaceae bacterium]|nr:hypothetical protein [Salinivirgaceae bacterium]
MRANAKRQRAQGVKSKAIRQWLLSGRPLTQLEATHLFGCLRLPSVVFAMRKEGIPVRTIDVRQDDGSTYARYVVDRNFVKDDRQLTLFDVESL